MVFEGINHALEPQTWAEQQFGEAAFFDVRRTERAITIAAAMAAQPGVSLPQLFGRWYDTKAAYNLFGHAEANPDTVQAGHRALVLDALQESGTYLLLEDTTELDWTGRHPIPGLGPVGNRNTATQGVLLHSVLAVRWPDVAAADLAGRRPGIALLGLADQQYHVRSPRPAGEANEASFVRKYRERESQLWERASQRLGLCPAAVRWVRVGDAGADIYEHLITCAAQGHGYVIRSAQDRTLAGPDGRCHAGRLYATARSQPALGQFNLALRARPGQPARTACLAISAVAVRLRSPQRPGAAVGSRPPVACTAVRVWEAAPPAGTEPLKWILLCDAPVTTFGQARECSLHYATRWLQEEFHKALKTGLGAERLQLATAARLFTAVAIMSVVALRLLDLREQVRCTPDQPAETAGLDASDLAVLRAVSDRPITTVREVALAIGRLGGHLNRKRDGLPGWQTLWRGLNKLQLLCEGVRLAKEREFG
jgi:hypothetical protein